MNYRSKKMFRSLNIPVPVEEISDYPLQKHIDGIKPLSVSPLPADYCESEIEELRIISTKNNSKGPLNDTVAGFAMNEQRDIISHTEDIIALEPENSKDIANDNISLFSPSISTIVNNMDLTMTPNLSLLSVATVITVDSPFSPMIEESKKTDLELDISKTLASNIKSTVITTPKCRRTHINTSTPLVSPSTSINSAISELSLPSVSTITNAVNSPLATIPEESVNSPYIADSESNNSEIIITEKYRKRKLTKKKDEGKVRRIHKSEWEDNKRKLLRNLGQEYKSRNGKIRPPKKLLPACSDKCRVKCNEKICQTIRNELFERFWSLGERVRQWEFLTRYCERITKRRVTTETPSNRKFTIRYFLPENLGGANKTKVCRTMFLNTFAIGEGIVRTALNKLGHGDGILIKGDDRGHHKNHRIIIDDEMIRSVTDHVKSFSPIESHYTRKDSSKLYLDSDLTINKMFKLYNDWISESDLYSNRAMTVRQYTDILNNHFNIEFHRPKKDQCDECTAFKNSPKPVDLEIFTKYDSHIKNKDMARKLKNQDKIRAINSPNDTLTAAFDFQKVLSTPHAETSVLYYKRKLSVFNFTIFDMGKKIGKCYMWHEGIAKKGANEVASCLFEYIKGNSEKGIKSFYFYSDNCSGQNRNRIVFAFYLYAAKKFNVNIVHRFLEKGHTQSENDSIHALIERSAKNKTRYTPEQWFTLVSWAKESGTPYDVKEVSNDDVFNFKVLLDGKNWSKNDSNNKILWSKIREIKVGPSDPDILYYKTDFGQDSYSRLIVSRTQNRRRKNLPDQEVTIAKAYRGLLPLPALKINDLKYLCDNLVIPTKYHNYYNSFQQGYISDSDNNED